MLQYASAFGVPALQLAVGQWAECSVMGALGAVGASVGGATGPFPELCGYALNVAQPPYTLATLPPLSVSSQMLDMFIGTTSAACAPTP